MGIYAAHHAQSVVISLLYRRIMVAAVDEIESVNLALLFVGASVGEIRGSGGP